MKWSNHAQGKAIDWLDKPLQNPHQFIDLYKSETKVGHAPHMMICKECALILPYLSRIPKHERECLPTIEII